MARIRTIKPEFWQDFRLAREFTRDQRLFYIALWNEADDEGRFQAHPDRLKGAVFPYDADIQGAFIEDSLRALAKAGKVVLYSVKGEPYGELVNFLEHQRINRPTPSRIPPPDKQLEAFTEKSVSDHGEISEDSLPEGKGREGEKEVEREKKNSNLCAFESEFSTFWEAYPLKVGKKAALKAFQARRREGVTPDQIMQGLRRYLAYKKATAERHHNPATFLGPNRWWDEPWEIPKEEPGRSNGRGGKNGPPEPVLDPKFKKPFTPIIQERRTAGGNGPTGNVSISLKGPGGHDA